MKKILIILMTLLMICNYTQAKTNNNSSFYGIINESGINKDSISICIRDAQTGNIVYSLNDKMMMNPASVQKILTMPAALETLGSDYSFKTELYARENDSYVIKLSGDPYLRYSELKSLIRPIERDAKKVYIDNSVLDSKIWGEGWQWDDDLNVLMPRFGAYNLDKNLIKLVITPSESGQYALISNPSKYPMVIINKITTSNSTSINVERETEGTDNTLKLQGTVANQTFVYVPTNNIKRYFEIRLTQALGENKVYLQTPYTTSQISKKDALLNSIDREIGFAINDILKNSNNMSAEIVFKLAGGKYKCEAGSDINGIEMFNNYCQKHGIDSSGIKITDGSGVSKNNLVTADFVSEFLYANKDSEVMNYLPKPGEGTLTQRMLPIKENLRAKTGTLSGISSIAGYITTKKNHNYTFCIIQNDVKLSASDKKMLEDYIIREIYLKL